MSKKISVGVSLALMFIAMTMTFAITMVVSQQIFDTTVNNMLQQETINETLDEMNKYVRGNYYSDINEDNISSSTARGFINGLGDSRNIYYSAQEYSELLEIENGSLVGIGAEFVRESGGLFSVVKVYQNSAAAGEGLLANTTITHVNDIEVKTISTEKAFKQMLYGAPGSEIRLTGTFGIETEIYTITRIKSLPPTVETQITEANVGYMRIHAFTKETPVEFENALTDLVSNEVKGILFDVRSTTGRNYDYVFQMLKLICKQGTFAKGEYKGGITKLISGASTDGLSRLENLPPIVVMLNEKTTGPGELFAICAKKLGDGYTSGVQTAGNGVLLSKVQQLSDGSAISIITAKILVDDNEYYEGVGVIPDVEATAPEFRESWLYTPEFTKDGQLIRSMAFLDTIIKGQPVVTDPVPDSSVPPESDPPISSEPTSE